MSLKFKVLFFIGLLLVVVSIGTTLASYQSALDSMERQLKNSTLPLSIDNIYNDIQKNILEPNLVASMMENDTFLIDWITSGEQESEKITEYLQTIQKRYGLLSTFFVSETTKRYFSHIGILKTIDANDPEDRWYFDFKAQDRSSEINLDANKHIDDDLIFFINKKIVYKGRLLGACGTALKISNIEKMLENFRVQHHFNVIFVNNKGEIIIQNKHDTSLRHLELESHLQAIIKGQESYFTKDGRKHLIKSKYIEDIQLYVIIEADIERFTQESKNNLYIDIVLSLLMATAVLSVIIITINSYQIKVERLGSYDALTLLANRRTFNAQFDRCFSLAQKSQSSLALLFIDIDDFKSINDTLGHMVGDEVLRRMAIVLKKQVKTEDLVARWGGEEFAVLLEETSTFNAKRISEEIRKVVESDDVLKSLALDTVTISIGVTCLEKDDTMDTILKRADKALYAAKHDGKNKTVSI